MILVDTSIWIDYFNGVETWQTGQLDHSLATDYVLTGDIILAEILQGFGRESDFEQAKKALESLDCVNLVGKEIALRTATNYRFLRTRGCTVRKMVDMLIATWCIEAGAALLHNDKDFDRIAEHLPLKTA